MVTRKKWEPFFGDMYNYVAKIDKDFHWSKDFGWYLKLIVEEKHSNHIWMTGMEKARRSTYCEKFHFNFYWWLGILAIQAKGQMG